METKPHIDPLLGHKMFRVAKPLHKGINFGQKNVTNFQRAFISNTAGLIGFPTDSYNQE
jgi:hypothetical protein